MNGNELDTKLNYASDTIGYLTIREEHRTGPQRWCMLDQNNNVIACGTGITELIEHAYEVALTYGGEL